MKIPGQKRKSQNEREGGRDTEARKISLLT